MLHPLSKITAPLGLDPGISVLHMNTPARRPPDSPHPFRHAHFALPLLSVSFGNPCNYNCRLGRKCRVLPPCAITYRPVALAGIGVFFVRNS